MISVDISLKDKLEALDNICYLTQTSLDTPSILLYLQVPLTLIGLTLNLIALVTLNLSHSSPTSFLLKSILCSDVVLILVYLPSRYVKLDPTSYTSAYVAMVIYPELYGMITIKYWLTVSLAVMTYVNVCRPLKSPVWNTYTRAYALIGVVLLTSALVNSIGFSQMKLVTTTYRNDVTYSVFTSKHATYAYDHLLHVLLLYPGTCLLLLGLVGSIVRDVRRSRFHAHSAANTPSLQTPTVAVLSVFTATHTVLTLVKTLQLYYASRDHSCDDVTTQVTRCDAIIIGLCCSNFGVLCASSREFRRKLSYCCRRYHSRKLEDFECDEEEELVAI